MAKIDSQERLTFEAAPVDETVLSIQFGSLPIQNYHIGLFWSHIRNEFPTVSEQLPIAAAFETFGVSAHRSITPASFQIENVMSGINRFWFEGVDPRDLFQLQQDRIVQNWRRRAPEDIYPRYGTVRTWLERDVQQLERFIQSEALGRIEPNQCEVSYINIIGTNDDQGEIRPLEDILTLWSGIAAPGAIARLDDSLIKARFLLTDDEGSPYGRVNATCQPAISLADQKSVVRLEITARAKPAEETLASAFEMMDHLHTAAVNTFASITTEKMHRLWGMKNAS